MKEPFYIQQYTFNFEREMAQPVLNWYPKVAFYRSPKLTNCLCNILIFTDIHMYMLYNRKRQKAAMKSRVWGDILMVSVLSGSFELVVAYYSRRRASSPSLSRVAYNLLPCRSSHLSLSYYILKAYKVYIYRYGQLTTWSLYVYNMGS